MPISILAITRSKKFGKWNLKMFEHRASKRLKKNVIQVLC